MGVGLVSCVKAPEVLNNKFHFLGKILLYKTLKGFFLGKKKRFILSVFLNSLKKTRNSQDLKILFWYSRRISYVYFLIWRAQEKPPLAFLMCLYRILCMFWTKPPKFWPFSIPVLALCNIESWIKMPSQSLSLYCGYLYMHTKWLHVRWSQ